MSATQKTMPRLRLGRRGKKALQIAAIVALIVAAGAAGAFYHYKYGDRTSSNFSVVTARTKQLLNVEIPERLWPKLWIERPDTMSMALWISKNNDECLAILACPPGPSRERGSRTDRLMQEAMHQYAPQFDTERWTGTEDRDIPMRGTMQRVRIANSFRTDDHKEVRVVSLDDLNTEQGTIALYFQTTFDSRTDDEIARLLKSLR